MLTAEQRERLKDIETWSARIAEGVSASEALALTNRITKAFEEYRRLGTARTSDSTGSSKRASG